MNITIEQYTVNPACEHSVSLQECGSEYEENKPAPITYWGVYLGESKISSTSTEELALKTKEWMENWLADKN